MYIWSPSCEYWYYGKVHLPELQQCIPYNQHIGNSPQLDVALWKEISKPTVYLHGVSFDLHSRNFVRSTNGLAYVDSSLHIHLELVVVGNTEYSPSPRATDF
jgi:hypothetical protein